MSVEHDAAAAPLARCRRARWWPSIAAAAAVLLVAACSGSGSEPAGGASGTGGRGATLTFADPIAPTTLDPAKADQNTAPYLQLVYDPLIRIEPDGTFSPALATRWGYVGEGNRVFEMTVRDGVRFSDGEPLTAAAVTKHLEHVRDARGSSSGFLQAAEIETPGPTTVRITLATPYPLVPFMLSQYNVPGNVISPRALDAPDTLGTAPVGAGKYVLDPAATIAGDRYTYTANPTYWDQPGIHYDRVVIRVIANPQSVLNALRTGQVDVAISDLSIADGARSAGLTMTGTPFLYNGLVLADRGGALAKPLGDVRVRQALNFAVDRAALAAALHGEHGTPTAQPVPRGAAGYSEAMESFYRHDPEQAKRLLADAGYPDGFSIDVLSTPTVGINDVAQAIAGELAKVGVTVNLITKDPAAYGADLQAGRAPAVAAALGAGPVPFEYAYLIASDAPYNPFHTADPQLDALTAQMLTAREADREEIDRRVQEFVVTQGWLLTVSSVPLPYYSTDTVTGIELSPNNPLATITDWRPAG